jgi:hypothetical protein
MHTERTVWNIILFRGIRAEHSAHASSFGVADRGSQNLRTAEGNFTRDFTQQSISMLFSAAAMGWFFHFRVSAGFGLLAKTSFLSADL